ncbi:MAG: thiamine phosphate synthase [Rhodospirillaceae bacterium]|nr:thiamine phosphate synthase [Rhodospirillaceae bacterium]MYF85971.1 thiamine phosphate synthase [Rhodospirillaceae bacterium]MYH35800.1 thiamine phosphate synthase [Rhodospirillaceae bacterium]MYK13685.1 thiamine phosphate synthase [Rhodospirillaceae bacterium]
MHARNILPDPPLMIVTDRRGARLHLEDIAAAAFEAGARWISVREKDLPPAEQRDLVRRLARNAPGDAIVGLHGTPTPAAGDIAAWHLPRDGDIAEARRLVPDSRLLGKSCHSPAAAQAAQVAGADYVTLSPVFATGSKPGYGPALGVEALEAAAAQLRPAGCRVLALGGVTPGTIGACRAAGADGAAVMGAVMAAADPEAAVAALIAAWEGAGRAIPEDGP